MTTLSLTQGSSMDSIVDGFGRSDYRVRLRSFFEVDRYHVAVAALKALADEGTIDAWVVALAIERYEIDTEPVPPWKR